MVALALGPDQGWVTSLAFSPDGNRLGTAHDDGTLKIWEQQRRAPDGPARTLLLLIDAMPEAVEQVLKEHHREAPAG